MSYQSEPWTLSDLESTPSNNKSSKRIKGIPDNFKESYMQYVKGEVTAKDLQHEFNIAESTIRRWRNMLNLPRKNKTNHNKIPRNLRECSTSESTLSADKTLYLENSFITLCVFGYQFSIKNPFVFKKIK